MRRNNVIPARAYCFVFDIYCRKILIAYFFTNLIIAVIFYTHYLQPRRRFCASYQWSQRLSAAGLSSGP